MNGSTEINGSIVQFTPRKLCVHLNHSNDCARNNFNDSCMMLRIRLCKKLNLCELSAVTLCSINLNSASLKQSNLYHNKYATSAQKHTPINCRLQSFEWTNTLWLFCVVFRCEIIGSIGIVSQWAWHQCNSFWFIAMLIKRSFAQIFNNDYCNKAISRLENCCKLFELSKNNNLGHIVNYRLLR